MAIYLRSVFSCDVRSLALFRMAAAIIVLIDLAMRWSVLEPMYTDSGYFTRELADQFYRLASNSDSFRYFSVHKLSGGIEFQRFLFVLNGIAALMLLVGFKTRWASIAVWVLVASMQARNPLINTSGDMLLKMLLFWSMFLPLGAIWSIDARNRAVTIAKRVTTVATAGIILQLCFMYWFTGFSKCNGIWFRGEALEYVLNLDIYARGFANTLLQFPLLTKLATWGTVFAEIVLPFLLFVPGLASHMRFLNIASFWMMHLMIALSMAIGLFSYISMIGWLPMLPSSFWNWPVVRSFAALMDKLFRNNSVSAQVSKRKMGYAYSTCRAVVAWRRGGRRLAQVFCGLLIVFCLFWNLGNIDSRIMPTQLTMIGAGLNLDQHFRMFDVPPQFNPWFVYDADLEDERRWDILRDKEVDFERPESVRLTIPNHHWRKLHRNLSRPELAQFRKPLSEYIVRRWNENHDEQAAVTYMKLTCFLDELGPKTSEGDQATQVWGEFGSPIARMLEEHGFDSDPKGF